EVDIADVDEEEESKPGEARERVNDACVDPGQQLGRDPVQFSAMLPEIIASESQKTYSLGRGLATTCTSVTKCWIRLRDEFLKIPLEKRRAQLLAGFLQSAMGRAPEETNALLDDVLANQHLHPYILY